MFSPWGVVRGHYSARNYIGNKLHYFLNPYERLLGYFGEAFFLAPKPNIVSIRRPRQMIGWNHGRAHIRWIFPIRFVLCLLLIAYFISLSAFSLREGTKFGNSRFSSTGQQNSNKKLHEKLKGSCCEIARCSLICCSRILVYLFFAVFFFFLFICIATLASAFHSARKFCFFFVSFWLLFIIRWGMSYAMERFLH